jgi:hypothetical protein
MCMGATGKRAVTQTTYVKLIDSWVLLLCCVAIESDVPECSDTFHKEKARCYAC